MGDRKAPTPPPADQRRPDPPPVPPDRLNARREAIAGAAVVALCGLAAKVDAPTFPSEGSPEDVQEWIIDVMKRVGARLASAKDVEFLRYVAGDYETPSNRTPNTTHQQLIELADRLEKGRTR